MPNIEVRGKYRTFRYDGTTPLDFTPYNNSIFLIRRPNPTTFVTLQQYVPGQGGAFTTFDPGSSYTMVTNADGSQDFNFNMGPYTRVDRLPSSTLIKTPNFYIGLDKNSIAVPISSYALSVNSPLSSVVNILYQNGQGNRLQYVAADSFKTGAPVNFTHFLPNSGYELRNRVPYTFFAPLKSEMGDTFATGWNSYGSLSMGHQQSILSFVENTTPFTSEMITTVNNFAFSAIQITGIFESFFAGSIGRNFQNDGGTNVDRYTTIYAMSAYGSGYKIFACGSNMHGKLGLGINNTSHYESTWKQLPGTWKSASAGAYHFAALDMSGNLWTCGLNNCNQLGISNTSTLSSNQLVQITSGINFDKIVCGYTYTALLQNTNLYFSGIAISRYRDNVFTSTGYVNELFEGNFTDIYNTKHGGGINIIALSSNRSYYDLLIYGLDKTLSLPSSRYDNDYISLGYDVSENATSQGFKRYGRYANRFIRKPTIVPVSQGCFIRYPTSNMNVVPGTFTRGLTADNFGQPSADGIQVFNNSSGRARFFYNNNNPGGTLITMYVYLDTDNDNPLIDPWDFYVVFNSNRLGTTFGFSLDVGYSNIGSAPQAGQVHFTGTFVDGVAKFDRWRFCSSFYSDYFYSVAEDFDFGRSVNPSYPQFFKTMIDGRNDVNYLGANNPTARSTRVMMFLDSNNKINYNIIYFGGSSSLAGVKKGIWKQLEKPYVSVFNCGVNQYYIEPGRPVPPKPNPNPPVVTPTPLPVYPQPPLSKVAVTYRAADADGSLRAVTFSDNGTGLNLNQSPVIDFKDDSGTNQDSNLTIDFEKNSTVSPQNSFNDLVRIRRRNNSAFTNMLKSINSSPLISPFININSFSLDGQTAFLNILPYSTSAPQGTYILGFSKTQTTNEIGTYAEYKSTNKGNTWSLVTERERTQFPDPNLNQSRVIIRNTNESYNGSTAYARLLQSDNDATGSVGGSNEPVFNRYIGRGLSNSAPGFAIRRSQGAQDPDLINYYNHNFRYSNNDIPYVILQNAVKEILLYSPNFTSSESQNTINPWNQLFKFSDSNIPDNYTMEETLNQFEFIANSISKVSINFDRNNSDLLYYSYPLFKRDLGANAKQDCGGIAVGTYNISTGVRTNRYAFRAAGTTGNNYSADVTSTYSDQKVNGHEFIVDNNNDIWLFILCDSYAGLFFGARVPITLYILKLNKTTGVWGLAKTLPLTQADSTINTAASIVYK